MQVGDLVKLKGDNHFVALVISPEGSGILHKRSRKEIENIVSLRRDNKTYIAYEADLEVINESQ